MQAVTEAVGTHDHATLEHQRRSGKADTGCATDLLPLELVAACQPGDRFLGAIVAGDLDIPQQLAGRGIERNQPSVDGADKHASVRDRHATVGWAAADLLDALDVLVAPEFAAGLRVQRHHVGAGQRHVHAAIDDDRRRLERAADAALVDPLRDQPGHRFRIDRGDVGKTVVVGVTSVDRPVERLALLCCRSRPRQRHQRDQRDRREALQQHARIHFGFDLGIVGKVSSS